jgi:hypothetical protein
MAEKAKGTDGKKSKAPKKAEKQGARKVEAPRKKPAARPKA